MVERVGKGPRIPFGVVESRVIARTITSDVQSRNVKRKAEEISMRPEHNSKATQDPAPMAHHTLHKEKIKNSKIVK